MSVLVPARRLAAGGAQHPFADLQDQAALLGDRDEDRRRDGAALGMLPAQQRLEADDLAGRQLRSAAGRRARNSPREIACSRSCSIMPPLRPAAPIAASKKR